jgi:hypothetical protein
VFKNFVHNSPSSCVQCTRAGSPFYVAYLFFLTDLSVDRRNGPPRLLTRQARVCYRFESLDRFIPDDAYKALARRAAAQYQGVPDHIVDDYVEGLIVFSSKRWLDRHHASQFIRACGWCFDESQDLTGWKQPGESNVNPGVRGDVLCSFVMLECARRSILTRECGRSPQNAESFFWGTLLQALGEYLWFIRAMGIILRLELQVLTYHK